MQEGNDLKTLFLFWRHCACRWWQRKDAFKLNVSVSAQFQDKSPVQILSPSPSTWNIKQIPSSTILIMRGHNLFRKYFIHRKKRKKSLRYKDATADVFLHKIFCVYWRNFLSEGHSCVSFVNVSIFWGHQLGDDGNGKIPQIKLYCHHHHHLNVASQCEQDQRWFWVTICDNSI